MLRWLLVLVLAACSTPSEPFDPWARGAFPVGHATVELDDADRERQLVVEVWYPAVEARSGASVATFESASDAQSVLQALLDDAPDGCPTQTMQAERDAPALARESPLVAYSHCLRCGRYSAFSLAAWLASHGIVVVAPDHAGPLPYADGSLDEPLDLAQLGLRAEDIGVTLDAAIDGSLFASNAALAALTVDGGAIGMLGHSFGSATAGRVTTSDGRIRAVAGLAAPMESPLLPGVAVADIDVPIMFVLAEEDNSIGELGNFVLRNNFDDAGAPAWRGDIADAGHWSVADVAGLVEPFSAGCGRGERHRAGRMGEPFDYLEPARGIEVTAQHITTFFAAHLLESPIAMERLADLPATEGVTVLAR